MESIDTAEVREVVEKINRECHVSDNQDRCDAGYEFTMCLQKIIDDHEELFSNMIDYDFLF